MPDTTSPRDLLRSTASDVAAHLGNDWTATDDGGWWDPAVELRGPDGQRLRLTYAALNYDRFQVSGVYPDGAPHGVNPMTATTAVHRGSRALAKVIATRVLPRYRAELGHVTAHLNAKARQATERHALAAELAVVVPYGTVRPDDNAGTRTVVTWWGDSDPSALRAVWGEVRITHDGRGDFDVEIKAHGLTADQARAIAAVLGG